MAIVASGFFRFLLRLSNFVETLFCAKTIEGVAVIEQRFYMLIVTRSSFTLSIRCMITADIWPLVPIEA